MLTNVSNDVRFNGTAKAESLLSTGDNVTIDGKGGGDTITGSDAYGEVFAFSSAYGDGNVISNFGANDTIRATGGNIVDAQAQGDDILVSLKGATKSGTVLLQGAAQYIDDVEFNKTSLVINAAKNIDNAEDRVLLTGSDKNDVITNSGENVTIDGGKGNDQITGSNFADVYVFGAFSGNDVITNFGSGDILKINSGAISSVVKSGDDYVVTVTDGLNHTGKVTLSGVGSKNLSVKGNYITIDEVREFVNDAADVKVEGTDFDDMIFNFGGKATLNGRGGNDTLYGSDLYEEVFEFGATGGRDLITGFSENDSLRITAGNIESQQKVGDDYVVEVKSNSYSGSVTLEGAGKYEFKKVVDETGTYLVVEHNNYIVNTASGIKVEGLADTVTPDVITNSGEHVTIQANAGNDTMTGSNFGDLYLLASNTGDNVITNFGPGDSIKATAGTLQDKKTWQTVGDDVIVTIKGTSFIGVETLL